MTRIRVGEGLFRRPLIQAIEMARPGDTLILDEGVHAAPSGIWLMNTTIVGAGDPSRTIIESTVEIRGDATLANLTVRALAFNNALRMQENGHLQLKEVTLIGDPAEKYPAVVIKAGQVTMTSCHIFQERSNAGVTFAPGTLLTADSSTLGWIALTGAEAKLNQCTVTVAQIDKRSTLSSTGWLVCLPPEGKRPIAVSGESVARIAGLVLRKASGKVPEIWCEESLLTIGAVDVDDGQRPLVLHKGGGRVHVPEELIDVTDPDAAEPALPVMVTELHWAVADAHSFKEVVLPLIARGGTVTMDAGEYFLDDFQNQTVALALTLVGVSPQDTVVHGTLTPYEDGELGLRDLTVSAAVDQNCIRGASGSITMTNVNLDQPEGATVPALKATDVAITMAACTVWASDDAIDGTVDLSGATSLSARDSALGWLHLSDESSLLTQDCSAYWLYAQGSTTIAATNWFTFLGNRCDKRVLVLHQGASASFDGIQIGGSGFEGYVNDARLAVGDLHHDEGGMFSLHVEGDADCSVPDMPAFVIVQTGTATVHTSDDLEVRVEAEPEHGPVEIDEPGFGVPDDAETEIDDPMAEIMLLTGLKQVKRQINSFLRVVKFNELRRSQGVKASEVTMHSIFLGNPGTGKTTVARLLGKALCRAGAVSSDIFVEVGRGDLVSENLGGSAIQTGKVLERARGGVLFIDEAYSLYQKDHNQFAQEAVDTILAFMENNRDDIVVVFAGYDEQMQDFLRMNPGLASRAPNTFNFEDYTPDEVATIGHEALLSDEYSVDEDLYRRIVTRRYGQSVTGGNGRWVRNFNEALIQHVAERVVAQYEQGLGDAFDSTLITDADLYELAGGDESLRQGAVDVLMTQLDELVGLVPVKAWVRELIEEAQADKMLAERGLPVDRPTYHMVFTGSPGTGKTTVASIIAQLFFNLGLLERSTILEVDRSDLVGAYIGHTEEKTSRVVDNAIGGVLFIDEAYQLYGPHENDFGRLAIETLITRLENDRDKFVAIFAGYTDDMKRFLSANEGLRSRIPRSIQFPDYTSGEVGDMVVARLSRSWTIDAAHVRDAAARTYAQLAPQDRSNGRWARTLADAIVRRHKRWIVQAQPTGEAVRVISGETVLAATGEL